MRDLLQVYHWYGYLYGKTHLYGNGYLQGNNSTQAVSEARLALWYPARSQLSVPLALVRLHHLHSVRHNTYDSQWWGQQGQTENNKGWARKIE